MPDTQKKSSVQEAVHFIEIRLNDELTPAQVAAHVGFSEFHFHRIFRAALKESVSDYIRKRRLIEAARRLLQSDVSIMELALRCRFESQEAFTRAFKRQFGDTPGHFRKTWKDSKGSISVSDRASEHLLENNEIGLEFAQRNMGEKAMEPKIVSREQELAIGLGGSFVPKSVPTINQLWNKFLARSSEIKNAKPGVALGICSKHHPSIQRDNDDSIIYVAALPVNSIEKERIPEGMVACTLAGGNYAVFTHRGPLRNLPETCDYIWGEWAASGKLKLRDAPDFELYDERFDAEKLDGEIDIYVPIE